MVMTDRRFSDLFDVCIHHVFSSPTDVSVLPVWLRSMYVGPVCLAPSLAWYSRPCQFPKSLAWMPSPFARGGSSQLEGFNA